MRDSMARRAAERTVTGQRGFHLFARIEVDLGHFGLVVALAEAALVVALRSRE